MAKFSGLKKRRDFKTFSQVPIQRITEQERKAVLIQIPKVSVKPSPISPKRSTINLNQDYLVREVPKIAEPPTIETPEVGVEMAPPKKPRAYAPFKSPKIVGLPGNFFDTVGTSNKAVFSYLVIDYCKEFPKWPVFGRFTLPYLE